MEDALGQAWSYDHDVLGRLTEQADPTGAINRYRYDALGNLLESTGPSGSTTRYTYEPIRKPRKRGNGHNAAGSHRVRYGREENGKARPADRQLPRRGVGLGSGVGISPFQPRWLSRPG